MGDEGIIAAAQEERFTRRKDDAALPVSAVRYCLDSADATIAGAGRLAFYEVPGEKLARQEWQAVQRRPGMT